MSRFEAPPGIITNGLVLNLDAGDPDSYTRSQPPYVEVLVVAGGGGGGVGSNAGGGGGAGGLIYNSAYQLTSAASLTVTIGAGGAGAPTRGSGVNGSNSVFGSLTAIGGGRGGGHPNSGGSTSPNSGGSGGGGAYNAGGASATSGQGFAGGYGAANLGLPNPSDSGGGGGGASRNGTNGQGSSGGGGAGGDGMTLTISGISTTYAGGGAGATNDMNVRAIGGSGGGGDGGTPASKNGDNGTANTGGGGGGGNGGGGNSGAGGSGITIVRYPGLPAATGGTITYLNGYTIHTFTTSGTFAPYLWNDVSGNGNNGTLVNGPTFISNQNGGVLSFDGTDDYATVASSPTFTVNTRTVQLVFRMNGSYANFAPLAIYSNGSSNSNRIWLGIQNSQWRMHGWGTNDPFGTTIIAVDTWYICTFSYNYPTQAMKMYTNGVLESSITNSEGGVVAAAGMNWSLATIPGGWQGQTYSDVSIASFDVYDRILSDVEVLQNFNAIRNRFGL